MTEETASIHMKTAESYFHEKGLEVLMANYFDSQLDANYVLVIRICDRYFFRAICQDVCHSDAWSLYNCEWVYISAGTLEELIEVWRKLK